MDMTSVKYSVGSVDKLILCIISSNCHLFNMFKKTTAIGNAISLYAHLTVFSVLVEGYSLLREWCFGSNLPALLFGWASAWLFAGFWLSNRASSFSLREKCEVFAR
jgi:hypothetical protein